MDSGQGGIMLLEEGNVNNNNMHTSVHAGSGVPSQFVGEGPASTMADAANTIHNNTDENAKNEAMMQLLNWIIPNLESLALKLETAKRGSLTTAGLHKLENPHAEGDALLGLVEVLERNNWRIPAIVNRRPTLRHADFKSGLLDPMSYPDSLNGLAEELSQGAIHSEDIGNYREFLLLLAGDLLTI